jgi:hypothetical protein
MRRIFVSVVLTVYLGLIVISASHIISSVYGQAELPPENVTVLNETALNSTQSNLSNNNTGAVGLK